MTTIFQAVTPRELDDVRGLMCGFLAWHRAHHVEDIDLIDKYFDEEAWERELAELPGKYAPEKGRLLVAYEGGEAVGCVALRDLGGGAAEMKRMFVPPQHRGQGIGHALAERVIAEAKEAGYSRVMLDTSTRQRAAIALYEANGFKRIQPYYDLSDDMRDWLVFFELRLP